MLRLNVLLQPWLPVGSSHAETTTVAEWAEVGGETAKVWWKDELKVNGEPATGVPSIEMTTVLVPPVLYFVRMTLRPSSQVRDAFGVWAETDAGAANAATMSAMTVSQPSFRTPGRRARLRAYIDGTPHATAVMNGPPVPIP
jgi:hypothetical protein